MTLFGYGKQKKLCNGRLVFIFLKLLYKRGMKKKRRKRTPLITLLWVLSMNMWPQEINFKYCI